MPTNKFRQFEWKDGATPTDGSSPTPISAANLNPIEVALRHLMGVDTPGKIDNIETELQNAIGNEIKDRTDAISVEANTRSIADTDLSNRATALENTVNGQGEGETRIPGLVNKVATLETNLNTEITNRGTAVSQEASTREQADARRIKYDDDLILYCGSSTDVSFTRSDLEN